MLSQPQLAKYCYYFRLKTCDALSWHVVLSDTVQVWLKVTLIGRFTHSTPFPCRPHAVPLPCHAMPCHAMPCHAAKGLECVFPIWFTQCSRVWITLAMPRLCHPRQCRSSQGHGTARPSKDGLWTTYSRSASSGYQAEFHGVVIRRIPISDASCQFETKHRLHGRGKEW